MQQTNEKEDELSDLKLGQTSEKLTQFICEAIASLSTEDKMWVPLEKIRNYIDLYFLDENARNIEKAFVPTLRKLVKQELVVRKANTFCFMAKDTEKYHSLKEKRKKFRKK